MRLFRHPRWQHLDYRVKVATTQENKPPTQGTRQWTFTTPRWRCGSILLPSLNAGVPEPTGGVSRTPVTKIMKWCPWETSNYLTQLWTKCILLCHIQWFNVNMPSQWKTMLQCNSVSHWLGAFTKWSLHIGANQTSWSTFNYLLI